MNCENCSRVIDGSYGSGRFCGAKCARGFATKGKRGEISSKVAKTLTGRKNPNAKSPWKYPCDKCGKKFRTTAALGGHTLHCIHGGFELSQEGRKRRGAGNRGKRWRAVGQIAPITRYWEKRLPDSLVFVVGMQYLDVAKRRYYARTPNVCEECGLGELWNSKRLRHQIDHKNGNEEDNRWENLRKLCPNCHTQTETFSWRNAAKKRKAGLGELADPLSSEDSSRNGSISSNLISGTT